jgi:hypothetical protein
LCSFVNALTNATVFLIDMFIGMGARRIAHR